MAGAAKRLRPGQRVRAQSAFKNLAEQGEFARGRFFLIWSATKEKIGIKPCGGGPAIGIVVSRKAQARAARRNKIKRRVREIFRNWQAKLDPEKALLIKAREGQKIPEYKEAEDDLLALFKKTGVFQ